MKRLVLTAFLASLFTVVQPMPARADLGNCTFNDGYQPHQGGAEPAVTSSARGIFGIITVRLPDLCNSPSDPQDSGSTVYVMLTNYSLGGTVWFQIGYRRLAGNGCAHLYTQRLDMQGVLTDVDAGFCGGAGVKKRFVIKKLQDDVGFYWQSYVLQDSDGTMFWDAPGDPTALGFSIGDGEYSSEVINEADQSGGGNASRAKLENAVWYDSNLNIVYADIPSGDRHCQRCNPSTDGFPVGPYNTNWLTNRSFEIWTDGF